MKACKTELALLLHGGPPAKLSGGTQKSQRVEIVEGDRLVNLIWLFTQTAVSLGAIARLSQLVVTSREMEWEQPVAGSETCKVTLQVSHCGISIFGLHIVVLSELLLQMILQRQVPVTLKQEL